MHKYLTNGWPLFLLQAKSQEPSMADSGCHSSCSVISPEEEEMSAIKLGDEKQAYQDFRVGGNKKELLFLLRVL